MQANSAELLANARQGNPKAIAQSLNRALTSIGITTRVTREQNRLIIFADAQEVPHQQSLVGVIQRGIKDLDIDSLESVKIYGRKVGDPSLGWREEVFFTNHLQTELFSPSHTKSVNSSGFSLQKVLSQASLIANNLIKAVRKIRISKRIAVGSFSFVMLVLLAYGGAIGFNLFQTRSAQAQS